MKQYVTLEDGTCFYQMMTDELPDPCIPGEGGRIFHLDYMIARVLLSPHFVVRRDEHRVVPLGQTGSFFSFLMGHSDCCHGGQTAAIALW